MNNMFYFLLKSVAFVAWCTVYQHITLLILGVKNKGSSYKKFIHYPGLIKGDFTLIE